MNKHYYVALVVEGFAASLMLAGLVEKLVYHCDNPSGFLINLGSFVGFCACAYFAKYIKWKKRDQD